MASTLLQAVNFEDVIASTVGRAVKNLIGWPNRRTLRYRAGKTVGFCAGHHRPGSAAGGPLGGVNRTQTEVVKEIKRGATAGSAHSRGISVVHVQRGAIHSVDRRHFDPQAGASGRSIPALNPEGKCRYTITRGETNVRAIRLSLGEIKRSTQHHMNLIVSQYRPTRIRHRYRTTV